MSYNVRRFVTNIDRYGVTHRYEIQQLNYTGTSSDIRALSSGMNFEHEELPAGESILKMYENPVQKGSLELKIVIQNASDRQLVDDIFEGDEEDFRLVWKQDGVVFWTGSVLNDLLEYPEENVAAKYPVSIYAKDFSRLEGIDYTNTNGGRGTIIEIIAELLVELGYSLDIESITSWTSENTLATVDFLQQHDIDRYALQTYARTGDEENEAITCLEALENICRSFCLILKQVGGVFLFEQFSGYENASAVHLTTYNPDGTQKTATTQNDVTGNANTIIIGSSITKQYPGLKSVRLKYDHRTNVSSVQFPSEFRLDDQELQRSFSELFISDGGQSINFRGKVKAQTNDTITDYEQWALYTLQAGTYYWNAETRVWQTTFVSNRINLTDTFLSGGKLGWEQSFNFTTEDVPTDADGNLIVTVYIGRNDTDGFADFSDFIGLSIDILNPIASQNSESIDYKLTQPGKYSQRYEHGDIWFGDGPVSFSRGAITLASDGSFTTDDWQRRGSTAWRRLSKNVLKEIIDVQRTGVKRMEANTENGYNPRKVKPYRGSNYVYGGGSYNGDVWSPVLVQINVQTATDIFQDLPKFETDGSGSSTSTVGSGGGTGGLTETEANAIYARQDLDLADLSNATIARANLGVAIGSDVQAWNAALDTYVANALTAGELQQLQNIDTVTISNTQWGYLGVLNQNLRTSDDVDFNQVDLGSQASATSHAVRADRNLSAGNGLTGGGNLTANRTVSMGTPSTTTVGGSNGVTGSSHTHALDLSGRTLTAGNGLTGLGNLGSDRTVSMGTPSTTTVGGSNGVTGSSHTHALDLSGRSLTAGAGLTGLGNLGSDRTVNMGTPSTVTVAGSNGTTATSHTHALDLSGRTLTMADDDDDVLTWATNAYNLGANRTWTPSIASHGNNQRGVITAGAQTIYGSKTFNADAIFSQDLRSPGAVSRVSGWQGNNNGDWDFRSVFADSLVVKAFTADVAQAFRGSRFLTKSFATIAQDFTIPAVSSSATLTVNEIDGFTGLEVFEQGDYILLNIINQSGGGLVVGEAWGEITSAITDNGDGTQSFTLTMRNLSAPALQGLSANEGSEALSFGSVSSPRGFIHDTVLDNVGSPYLQVVTWTTNPWNRANWTVRTRTGNLAGVANASGFGFYGENSFLTGNLLVGDLSKQGQYLEYDGSSLTIITGSGNIDDKVDASFVADATAGLALESYVDTQVSNATANLVTTAQLSSELDGYATEAFVSNATAGLALESYVDTQVSNATANLVTTAQLSSELDGYATEVFVSNATAGLALESYVDTQVSNATANLVTTAQLSSELDGYATEAFVSNATAGLALESYVDTEISNATANLVTSAELSGAVDGLASETFVNNATAGLALESYVDSEIASASAVLTAQIETVEGDVSAAELRLDAVEGLGSTATLTADNFNLQSSTDFWRTSDNRFQFGGSNGLAYDGSLLTIGSDVLIDGADLAVSSLPRVSDEGLVGLWRFDGSGVDALSAANGIENNITYESFVSGKGAVFNGNTSRIEVPHSLNHLLQGGGIISYWVKQNTYTNQSHRHIFKGSASTDGLNGYQVIHTDLLGGNERVWFRIDGGDYVGSAPGSVPFGAATHVLIYFDTTGAVDIYIDGSKSGSGMTNMPSSISSTNSLWFGQREGNSNRLDGIMGEVRIYNDIGFTSSDIQALAKSLYLHPSGNSGGLISADTVVATEGFFNQLTAFDADIGGTLTIAPGGVFQSEVLNFNDTSAVLGPNAANMITVDTWGVSVAAQEFDLNVPGVLQISSDPFIKMKELISGQNDGGGSLSNIYETMIIDPQDRSLNNFETITEGNLTVVFDDGLPQSDQGRINVILFPNNNYLVRNFRWSRYCKITQLRCRTTFASQDLHNFSIRIEARKTGGFWNTVLVGSQTVISNVSLSNSLQTLTLENPITFYADPQFDEIRAVIFNDAQDQWEFERLWGEWSVNQSFISNSGVDITSLRVKEKIELIDPFENDKRVKIEFENYKGNQLSNAGTIDDPEMRVWLRMYADGEIVAETKLLTHAT